MQINTIPNRIQKHRAFVYDAVRLEDRRSALALRVDIYPHVRNRSRCSGCGQRGDHYDTLDARHFEFVPLWGIRVFFVYLMRRVSCPRCGFRVERVPWADGKQQVTTTYTWSNHVDNISPTARRCQYSGVKPTHFTNRPRIASMLCEMYRFDPNSVILGLI